MFIGGGSRYSSFPVHRCRVPWIQKLTSIWTTLYPISSVKKIRRQISWHVLKLDLNSARWMPKLEYRRSELPGLDVTISARYHWSVARQLTPFPLRHRNLRNLTLQTLWLFSAYARLYNAVASPASRLRSAGSLAIINHLLAGPLGKREFCFPLILRPVHTSALTPAARSCNTLSEQSSLVCTNDF